MNVEITKTWDTDLVSARIHCRFLGTINLEGKGALEVAEGIRVFARQCEMECDFLSHREPKAIVNDSPTIALTANEREITLRFDCTPIEAFERVGGLDGRNDRDSYINQVLEVRGYVPWLSHD